MGEKMGTLEPVTTFFKTLPVLKILFLSSLIFFFPFVILNSMANVLINILIGIINFLIALIELLTNGIIGFFIGILNVLLGFINTIIINPINAFLLLLKAVSIGPYSIGPFDIGPYEVGPWQVFPGITPFDWVDTIDTLVLPSGYSLDFSGWYLDYKSITVIDTLEYRFLFDILLSYLFP